MELHNSGHRVYLSKDIMMPSVNSETFSEKKMTESQYSHRALHGKSYSSMAMMPVPMVTVNHLLDR